MSKHLPVLALCLLLGCGRWKNTASDGSTGSPPKFELRGRWTGYVEQFAFPDGSDEVVVVVDEIKANDVVARVTLGRGPAERAEQSDAGSPPPLGLVVGVPLAARGTITGQRLKLEVPLDVWSAWCTAQKPRKTGKYLDAFGCPTGGYSYGSGGCAFNVPLSREASAADGGTGTPLERRKPHAGKATPPDSGLEQLVASPDAGLGSLRGVQQPWRGSTTTQEPIECEQLTWCGRLRMRCICTEGACRTQPPPGIRFDVRIRGTEADGSVELPAVRNVRLTQSPR